jgi:hypothetical protein
VLNVLHCVLPLTVVRVHRVLEQEPTVTDWLLSVTRGAFRVRCPLMSAVVVLVTSVLRSCLYLRIDVVGIGIFNMVSVFSIRYRYFQYGIGIGIFNQNTDRYWYWYSRTLISAQKRISCLSTRQHESSLRRTA